jgi:IS30 family transposase
VFPVILTDNGGEFSNPILFETSLCGGKRTSLYYCEAGKSNQKGSLENNHEYIRYILPKGTSFEDLNDEAVLKMINNINSTIRPGLDGSTPLTPAFRILDKEVLDKLGLVLIPADDVCLNASLIK